MNYFVVRLIVAASAILITVTLVGLYRVVERMLENSRRPKISTKAALTSVSKG